MPKPPKNPARFARRNHVLQGSIRDFAKKGDPESQEAGALRAGIAFLQGFIRVFAKKGGVQIAKKARFARRNCVFARFYKGFCEKRSSNLKKVRFARENCKMVKMDPGA